MNYYLIALFLFSFNAFATSSRFECKYLDYHLQMETRLVAKVSHQLKINGQISVKELTNEKWFIEAVNCKKSGFEIIASHAQYNDFNKQVFLLTYNKGLGYKLKKMQ